MQRLATFGAPALWEASVLALLMIGSIVLALASLRWPTSGLAAR